MNQSSIIAAAFLAGFALYLAANDRLKVYAAVLWGDTKQPLPSSQASPGGFAAPGASGGSSSMGGGMPELNSGNMGLLEEAAPLLLEAF